MAAGLPGRIGVACRHRRRSARDSQEVSARGSRRIRSISDRRGHNEALETASTPVDSARISTTLHVDLSACTPAATRDIRERAIITSARSTTKHADHCRGVRRRSNRRWPGNVARAEERSKACSLSRVRPVACGSPTGSGGERTVLQRGDPERRALLDALLRSAGTRAGLEI